MTLMSAQQQYHERFIDRLKRRIGRALLESIPAPKFPAKDWTRYQTEPKPVSTSWDAMQVAARIAWEKCTTHGPGEMVQVFNRVWQASSGVSVMPESPYASEPVRPVQLIERAQLEKTALREDEDEMPAWARRPEPEQYLGAVPSRPLAPQDDAAWLNSVARVQVWAEPEPERQSTGALDALAILAAQKQAMDDGDTLEVPAYMKQKHEKKESE